MKFFSCFLIASLVASEPQDHPLISYEFSTESCERKIFFNSGIVESQLSIIRNETTTKCSPGLGVESLGSFASSDQQAYFLKGSSTIRLLLNHLESQTPPRNGITLSFWLNVFLDPDEMTTSPIFVIGSPSLNGTSSIGLTECDERQVDFQLSVRKHWLEVVYRTSNPFVQTCTRMRLAELPIHPGMHHVAITLGDGHQQVFLDGIPSAINQESFQVNLKHWNSDSIMYFFSFPGYNYPAWSGRIYQFSIFGEVWNDDLTKSEMQRGLSASNPCAISKRIEINEDAEVSPRTHNVDWYRTPTAFSTHNVSTMPIIDLPIDFVEYEVDAFLQSTHIYRQPSWGIKFYIIKAPSRGELYQMDGTQISNGNYPVALLKNQSVVFIPGHNEHSVVPGSIYTSFKFCVTKEVIFSPSQCESSGTIDIVVNAVNDPPIPIVQRSPYIVHEGVYEESYGLKLSGKDVDFDDYVTVVEITSSPRYGNLYLSVPSFRDDGLLHGTMLSDLNFSVPGSEVYVEYRYLGSDQVTQGMSVKDSFRFRVFDSNGSWSEDTTVEIKVLPTLGYVAQADLIVVKEEENAVIVLGGSDKSGLNRSIAYFFERVPRISEGVLINENSILESNEVATSQTEGKKGTQELNITFQPAPNVCSNATSVNVTFGYRVVAFSDDNQITSASSVVEEDIKIECKQKPLQVVIPQDSYNINTFVGSVDDPCNGYIFNASSTDSDLCSSAAIISGIKITGHDTRREKIAVSISATNGLLTVNREQREHIRPIGGQEEMRSTIQLLVLPSKLNDVLSYLHYQTETPGTDEIRITLHCCKNATSFSSEVFDDPNNFNCQDIVAFIQIEASEVVMSPPEKIYSEFPWFSLSSTLTMLCLLKAKGKWRKLSKLNAIARLDWRWRQHLDSRTGASYYENVFDGTVTWQQPDDIILGHDGVLIEARSLHNSEDTDVEDWCWRQHFDSNHGAFYYENISDGAVTWQQPDEIILGNDGELIDARGLHNTEDLGNLEWRWRQRFDSNHRAFFYENATDGTVTWQPPDESILGYHGELLNDSDLANRDNLDTDEEGHSDPDFVIGLEEVAVMAEELQIWAIQLREIIYESVNEKFAASVA